MTFNPNNLDHKISQARTRVILRDPFFASILMEMNPVIDASVTETCATNGDQVIFNPEWLADANPALVAAAMRKMSLHVALSHHLRRGPLRDPARWRTACDQAALHVMHNEGVELPEGAMAKPIFAGMTAEEIYRNLEESEDDDQSGGAQPPQGGAGDDQGQGEGDGSGDDQGGSDAPQQPGADGGVGQALDGADMRDQNEVNQKQADNDQRVIRAAMAEKSQGKESGFSKELVEQVKSAGVDWRDRLQYFIDSASDCRYSWSKPNRRFIGQNLYLPGKIADGIDCLAFIVDTSGSMSSEELGMCAAQIEAARDAIGIKKVVVIQIDTRVKQVDEYEDREPLPVNMEFKGRGGTNMQPAFEEAEKHSPTACIMLTDGYFDTLDNDPGYPVIFAITAQGRQGVPCATYGDFIDLPPKAAA